MILVQLRFFKNPQAQSSPNGMLIEFKNKNQPLIKSERLVTKDIDPNDDENVNQDITSFLKAKAAKKFQGKTITLQSKDAEVRDILKLIGEASGFNIIISDNVKGHMNLSLIDVPWDQALDVVLSTNHLGAERVHNILRIMPLDSLKNEKEEQIRTKLASQAAEPRATRIFSINYAILKDLQTEIQSFVNALASAGSSSIVKSSGGFVQIDERTNSLIV
jgi:type IV pilus assembly protein PilQ